MNNNVAVDRDALYYPYIHITDVNWLKATLLCFPSVRRMVPPHYVLKDTNEIREFRDTAGPRGPLLRQVDLFSPAAMQAESSLLKKLEENNSFIHSKYSRRQTKAQYGRKADGFNIHVEKISHKLTDFLLYYTSDPDSALAWVVDKPDDRPQRSGFWLALHPTLGRAILSVKAISIATDLGLDIVTDSDSVHHTVVSKKQDDIFQEIIGNPPPKTAADQQDTIDDLAEVVIATNFDVSKLSAKGIAKLLSDGNDLRKFKDALAPFAARIPLITNSKEREERLRDAAAQVVAEWERYRKSLGRLALDVIYDAANIKWPELANSSLLGAGTALGLGAGPGIGIFLVSYGGFKIWRKYREQTTSPYSYLSRIQKLQSRMEPRLTLPPMVYSGM